LCFIDLYVAKCDALDVLQQLAMAASHLKLLCDDCLYILIDMFISSALEEAGRQEPSLEQAGTSALLLCLAPHQEVHVGAHASCGL
jgi:hypothetical protein